TASHHGYINDVRVVWVDKNLRDSVPNENLRVTPGGNERKALAPVIGFENTSPIEGGASLEWLPRSNIHCQVRPVVCIHCNGSHGVGSGPEPATEIETARVVRELDVVGFRGPNRQL